MKTKKVVSTNSGTVLLVLLGGSGFKEGASEPARRIVKSAIN